MKMKWIPAALLVVCFLICCGCGKTDGAEKTTAASDTTEAASGAEESGTEAFDFDVLAAAYQTPEAFTKIDMKADDPSTDKISFSLDDAGRVEQCTYKIDGRDVLVVYRYDESELLIIAMVDSWVVDEKHIELPGAFDPALGFKAVQGYYIKGFSF